MATQPPNTIYTSSPGSPPGKRPLVKKVEPFFFNPTLKLAALRMAIFASAAVLGTAIALFVPLQDLDTTIYIAVLPVTLHCVNLLCYRSAFKVRFMIRLLDLLLLIAEIALFIRFNGTFFPSSFDPTSLIVFFVATWCLIAVLLFLLICRVAAIVRHKGRNLFKPFNFLEDSQRIKGIPVHGLPAAYSMLFGRSIWRVQFIGEGLIVRLLRGSIAGIFIAALIGYGVLSLIVKPVQETALTPVKESRGQGLPFDEIKDLEPQSWNFVFTRPIPSGENTTGILSVETFHQAVNVTALWEGEELSDGPSCLHSSEEQPLMGGDDNAFNFQIIHVQCIPKSNGSFLSDFLPDVLVEVDYGALSMTPNVLKGLRGNVIGIYVGFTTDLDFLTGRSSMITLPPSAHYLAGVRLSLRRLLKRPALSGFGMFEGTNSFSAAEVQSIVPDPLVALDPPAFNTSANFATFRLFVSHDTGEVRIVQDSREESVLGGFSALGGLWTFLGGIFAMFFGTSLMKIFFDSKPLSIFGIAQQMEKDAIARAYLRAYPNIRQELNLPPSQRGVMTMLQDHMIDVALFQEAIDETQASSKEQEWATSGYDVEKLGMATSAVTTPGVEEVHAQHQMPENRQ
ncbi:hypothetical protein CVT24_011502 [Panaeolus cyanescens]|uniref:Uncharacterized protein n=1 Tax=Panaeolus cyanescens TaxID=181874 RepID=A0A409VGQ2_9AGAR|nr:hypothetical protein CVT24_011502 [Panaeolus cyanescens]